MLRQVSVSILSLLLLSACQGTNDEMLMAIETAVNGDSVTSHRESLTDDQVEEATADGSLGHDGLKPNSSDNSTRGLDVSVKEVKLVGRWDPTHVTELPVDKVPTILNLLGLRIIQSTDLDAIRSDRFTKSLKTGAGEQELQLQELQMAGQTVIIPEEPLAYPLQFTITNDGSKSIIYADNGLWLVGEDHEFMQLSMDTYQGRTYEDLKDAAFALHDDHIVHWNMEVTASPDGAHLVYRSNKDNIELGEESLFVYDFASGEESIMLDTPGASYTVEGWLSDHTIIARRHIGEQLSYVLVTLDGHEYEIDLKGEFPYVYDVQAGLVAYAESLSSGQLYIAHVSNTGVVEERASLHFEGQTRLRGGSRGLSPDQSYFAFIYVDSSQPNAQRFIKIYDLFTGEVMDVTPIPGHPNARTLDFRWLSGDELLILAKEEVQDEDILTPWVYRITEGG